MVSSELSLDVIGGEVVKSGFAACVHVSGKYGKDGEDW